MDPDQVRRLHEQLSMSMDVESSQLSDDDEVALAEGDVRTYRRRIGGKLVVIRGYKRKLKPGEVEPPKGTSVRTRVRETPPRGRSFEALAFAKSVLNRWSTEKNVSDEDETKSHQEIVKLLMKDNSPWVQGLKRRLAQGAISADDLKAQYRRIATLYLKALAKARDTVKDEVTTTDKNA